jgi:hypothetical protein
VITTVLVSLGSASIRCHLASSRNASQRRGWLLPGCAADELRVGGFLVSYPVQLGSGWSLPPPFFLIWADLRREGPISAYVAATDWIVGASVEHPAGLNTKRRRREKLGTSGQGDVGDCRQTYRVTLEGALSGAINGILEGWV